METNSLWEILNSPLMVGLIVAFISQQIRIIPSGFYPKIFKKTPDYLEQAGVNPLLWRFSGKKLDPATLKPVTRKEKIVATLFSLAIFAMVVGFTYYSLKLVVTTPAGYTNLTLTRTGEQFLLSEEQALSYPDKTQWRLDQEQCHRDIYPELGRKFAISEELVYEICTTVGMEGKKNMIKESVDRYNRDKGVVLSFVLLFVVYAAWMIASLMAPIVITPKLIAWREKWLKEKYLGE